MPDTIENSDSYGTAEKFCACLEFHLPEDKSTASAPHAGTKPRC
jgi:hypothetical protein